MKLSNDLGKDSILGLVFKLAIPAMLSQLVNLLYSIIIECILEIFQKLEQ